MRAIAIVSALLLVSAPLHAQIVQGRTLDASNRAWVPAAVVTLRSLAGDSVGVAITNAEAAFRIPAPRAGRYVLHASRIGFADVVTTEFAVRAGEHVTVEVLLGTDPVELSPLNVTSRRYGEAGLVGAHRRRAAWIERTGIGRVITRAEIEASPRAYVTDYLYGVSGVQVVGNGSDARIRMRGCTPSVFVDGVRAQGMSVNAVTPDAIEGIEVYRSVSEVPPELRGGSSSCGAVALWTRVGERTPGKWTLLQKIFAVAGGTALGVLMVTQF